MDWVQIYTIFILSLITGACLDEIEDFKGFLLFTIFTFIIYSPILGRIFGWW